MPSENQFFLNEGVMGHQSVSGFVGGQIPRLYGGTIFGGATHLGVLVGHRTQNVHFSTHLRQLRGYSAFTDLINNQSIGEPQGTLHTLVWILELVTDWAFVGAKSADFLGFLRCQKLSNFFDPPNFRILTYKLAQMCNNM